MCHDAGSRLLFAAAAARPPKSPAKKKLGGVEPGLNILVLLPSQTVTPLSPGRGGARAGAAGVRRVCGMSVGPKAISDMPVFRLPINQSISTHNRVGVESEPDCSSPFYLLTYVC